jgi:ABC-type dipeptide/oligopeptide/nickel transport system permease subunit
MLYYHEAPWLAVFPGLAITLAELRRRYPDAELNDDVDEFLEEARSRRWLESNSTA